MCEENDVEVNVYIYIWSLGENGGNGGKIKIKKGK